ncbi:MAG: type III pantothenate kinase [bacterium]|nr:type III pantothenate kinase [bacterium]
MKRRGTMMLLTVDIGNTRVKLARMADGKVTALESLVTTEVLAGSLASFTIGVRSNVLSKLEGVIVASVVPSANPILARILTEQTGIPPHFVDHSVKLPFSLRERRPERIGIDRICAAVGAIGPAGAGAIVIDIGTAITVDLVANKHFEAGPILPGPGLGLAALGASAEQLPDIDVDEIQDLFPSRTRDTREAMILGAGLATLGGIREAVRRMEAQIPRPIRKVVTGGGAGALAPHLPGSWKLDPHIVHRGLYRIWCQDGAAGRPEPADKTRPGKG